MYDALVLAGGAARRLGGVDKAALLVGDATLLDRVLLACAGAARTVVVGPQRPTAREVLWAWEEPAGSGPVSALAAGLVLVRAETVLVLAADLPFFSPECAAVLVARAPAVLLGDGHRQWLCGAWPAAALRQAVARAAGERLGALLDPLGPAEVTWDGAGRPWDDCDTEADLQRARELA